MRRSANTTPIHTRTILLMTAVGVLQTLVAVGFPVNPSFTPEAVKEYKVKADAGDAEAQYLYALALSYGEGVKRDVTNSFVYAKKAADQGYARAYRMVGLKYEKGRGVATNATQAAEYHSRFVAWATKAAAQNDADAQFKLGICYEYGQGVETNFAEAARWYRAAAELGCARARYNFFDGCEDGKWSDTNVTDEVCTRWCLKAAEQGDAWSQFIVADDYESGVGVEKNLAEAIKWYRKSAEQGCASAQLRLGWHYLMGKAVAKNPQEAVAWFRKAANQDDETAQLFLGGCYANGVGVEKDRAEARKWYGRAKQGDVISELFASSYRGLTMLWVLFGIVIFACDVLCQAYPPKMFWRVMGSGEMPISRSSHPKLWWGSVAKIVLVASVTLSLVVVCLTVWIDVSSSDDIITFVAVVIPGEVIAGLLFCGCIAILETLHSSIREWIWLRRLQHGGLMIPTYEQYVRRCIVQEVLGATTMVVLMITVGWLTTVPLCHLGGWCTCIEAVLYVLLLLVLIYELPTRKKYDKLIGTEH